MHIILACKANFQNWRSARTDWFPAFLQRRMRTLLCFSFSCSMLVFQFQDVFEALIFQFQDFFEPMIRYVFISSTSCLHVYKSLDAKKRSQQKAILVQLKFYYYVDRLYFFWRKKERLGRQNERVLVGCRRAFFFPFSNAQRSFIPTNIFHT